MPPLVIPDALQVTVKGAFIGRPWTAVYGVQIDDPTPLTEAVAQDVRDLFTAYYAALAPLRSPVWRAEELIVTDIRGSEAPQFLFDLLPIVGTGVGDPTPPDLAIVVSWLTTRRGGSFRGRTYHNGFTEDGMEGGRLGADEVLDETTAAEDFITSFPGGMALGVISRKNLEVNVVNRARVNDVFDRQLRRRFPQGA